MPAAARAALCIGGEAECATGSPSTASRKGGFTPAVAAPNRAGRPACKRSAGFHASIQATAGFLAAGAALCSRATTFSFPSSASR